jgi:uncharacterized membrane protein YbaN (DUF454 family)
VRILLILGGLLCVGLATLGAILPGLPTTPWVLLASWCFARSSPALNRWLLRSPVFGPLLRDWHQHRGIRPAPKAFASCLVVLACSASIGSGRLPTWAMWTVGGCGLIGLTVLLAVVPTIRRPDPPPDV